MSKPLRLLILDIDEVATNRYTFMDGEVPCIDPSVSEMIRELIKLYGFKIVFISTWADNFDGGNDVVQMAKLSEAMGFGRNVWHEIPIVPKELSSFRGDRMNLFFDKLKGLGIEIDDYVIIDDSCDYYMNQMPHLIHVDGRGGFSIRDYLAIRGRYEESFKQLAEEHPWTSGVYLDADSRWLRITREEFPAYARQTRYKQGQIVHLSDMKALVEFIKEPYYDQACLETPIILTGQNQNARVLSNAEVSRLGQENFINKHSKG